MADEAKRPVVRLSDVAKRARCSAATVSRVLNAPESVNREARLRVEAAVRELGYTRNGAARALRSRRSEIVGVILPTLKQPVYADFIDTLQDTLGRRNYALIVTTCEYSPERELFQARLIAERGIDGLVLIGHTHLPETYTLMQAQDMPYVVTHSYRSDVTHPVIGFDNVAAMGKVVDHLFGLGHRDFALLSGVRRESDLAEERVRGVLAALGARGMVLPPVRVVEEALTVEGGRRGLRRLLAAGFRPTALLCTSDMLAYGALVEARTQGIAVPDRMSVTGFDDLPASAHFAPALTTIAVPSAEIGRRAGDQLTALLAGDRPAAEPPLATTLVVRESTAAPPADGRR